MESRRLSPARWLCLLLIPSCGGGPLATPDEEGLTYYRDVKPLLDAYCVNCHSEGQLAPFRLDSYDAVQRVAPLLPSSIASRQMPPFLAAPAIRPLEYDTSLSDEQIALISAWVEDGARMGDPAHEGPPIVLPTRTLERVDRIVEMFEPYTPTQSPDEYRCFILDWQEAEARFITGVEFLPGNPAVAHHAVIYAVDAEDAAIVDTANGADGKPGYSCFGAASPDGAPEFPSKLVAAWAPGVGATVYPQGAGARVEPDARVILQMHYSILSDGSSPDQSGAALQLSDTVEYEAGFLPWLDINWPLHPDSMLIPANQAEVTHEYLGDPTQSFLLGVFTPGANPSEGLVLHSVFPHMHKLGSRMSLQLERQDGTVEPLIEISRWNFDWQAEFVFQESPTMFPGDQLRVSCTWDNTAQNQPIVMGEPREPVDVTWGAGTFDEMCVAFLFVHGVAKSAP